MQSIALALALDTLRQLARLSKMQFVHAVQRVQIRKMSFHKAAIQMQATCPRSYDRNVERFNEDTCALFFSMSMSLDRDCSQCLSGAAATGCSPYNNFQQVGVAGGLHQQVVFFLNMQSSGHLPMAPGLSDGMVQYRCEAGIGTMPCEQESIVGVSRV